MNKEFFMQLAIKEAYKYIFLTYPNPAVGAVVLRNGAILSIEAHQRAGTSHAEVLALLSTYETITNKKIDFDRFNANLAHKFLIENKNIFKDCEIYVTLEPCSHMGKTPSCANLIKELKLKKIYIGTKDPISSHSGGIELLEQNGIEVEYGTLEDKCKKLIEPFLIWQNRAFVLFKIAQSINGQIGGGYISSKESLKYVHKIRDVCTKLLIGGNTIRVDKPTLDARFIKGKAPDIYIYSKKGNFSKDIALFNVPNRKVEIGNDLSFLEKPGFVLVEGGEGILRAMKNKMDYTLTFIAPKIKDKNIEYFENINLEFLNTQKVGIDLAIISKLT